MIFDPFLGSGTILVESAHFGLSAYGTELNPAAVGLAKIYELINVEPHQRETIVKSVENIVDSKPNLERLVSITKESKAYEAIVTEALIIGLDLYHKEYSIDRLNKAWEQLKSTIKSLPFSTSEVRCFNSDAREVPLSDDFVDLVITSPPYINVFNYHQNYRKSAEAIGYNVLNVAKSEIGANRKFRGNRYLTVIQYCIDIAMVFNELRRVCKDSAKVIFIVGRESTVKKTRFFNSALLTKVAELAGFKVVGNQERYFTNKFGQKIYEDILRFEIGEPTITEEQLISGAREIGISQLKGADTIAPEESKNDLEMAIIKGVDVSPSVILKEI